VAAIGAYDRLDDEYGTWVEIRKPGRV